MQTGSLDWSSQIDTSGFKKSMDEMEGMIKNLSQAQKQQGSQIEDFAKKAAAAAAGYFSIQAASNFVQSMVKVRGEFQQIEVAYRTMLGSKEKADQLMAESVKLAAITPFTLQDVASGSKQLLAYGFAAKDITENLEMLGNVASGVGSQLGDLTYLYGTLKASGRVTQIDINQFAGRGIPIYQALADVMKINVEQVREYVSAGKIGFSDVESAFQKLTGAGGQFFNLMQEQSKTLTGQLSNLEDAWSRMLNDLGKQNEGLFATAIDGAINLVDNYQTVIDILGALVVGYGTYRAALLLSAATTSIATYATAGFTAAEILQYYWTTTLTKAQRLLNLTMLANPYVAVASALAALGTYLYLASEATDNLKKSQENLSSIQETAKKSTIEQKQTLEDLLKVAKDETKSLTERESALRKINTISPQFLGSLTLATLKTQEGKKAIDDYNKSIDLMALKQASFDKRVELQKQKAELLSGNSEDKLSFFERAKAGLKTGKSGDFNKDEYTNVVKEKAKLIDKQLQDISAYEAKAVAEYNTKEAPTIKTLRNVSFLDKEIEALKENQKTVSSKKEYSSIQSQINKLEKEKIAITGESAKVSSKYAKDEQDWQQKRLDFQQKINEAYSSFNISQLSQNAQEIAQNKAKYDALRKDFNDYNDEAKKVGKSQLGSSVLSQINNLESKEQYSIKYNQQTKLQSEAFDKQKKLYEDYEDYKTKYGKQEADNRFGNELKNNKQLLEEQSKIVASLSVKSALGGGLNAEETARFEQAKKNVLDLHGIDEKRYSDAYEMALTHSQNIERINEKYRQAAIDLRENITDEQKTELLRQRDAAVEAAKDEAIQKTEVYRTQAAQVLELTRKQVKDQIAILKTLLDDKNIPKEVKSKIEGEINKLEFALKVGIDQNNLNALNQQIDLIKKKLSAKDGDGESLITKQEFERLNKELQELIDKKNQLEGGTGKAKSGFAKGLEENFAYLKGTASEVLTGLSTDLGQISGSFGELSNALGGVNTEAGYTLDTIGQLVGVASDAAGAAASFASGDIIGGVTKTIKAISGIFSIGKKVKEMNAAARKEVEDFYSSAISGEREYQDLLTERRLQNARDNKNVLQGIREEIALRKKQLESYATESTEIMAKLQGQSYISAENYTHGTWFRKAKVDKTYTSLAGKSFKDLNQLLLEGKLEGDVKALVERLAELEQKGYDAEKAMADLYSRGDQFFTGTTANDLAAPLISTFVDGQTNFINF